MTEVVRRKAPEKPPTAAIDFALAGIDEAEMLNGDDGEGEEDQHQDVDEVFFRGLDQVVPDKGDGDLDDGKPDDADDEVGVQEILHAHRRR